MRGGWVSVDAILENPETHGYTAVMAAKLKPTQEKQKKALTKTEEYKQLRQRFQPKFERPSGRAPTNSEWDYNVGQWIPSGTIYENPERHGYDREVHARTLAVIKFDIEGGDGFEDENNAARLYAMLDAVKAKFPKTWMLTLRGDIRRPGYVAQYRIKCPCIGLQAFVRQNLGLKHVPVCKGVGDANKIPKCQPIHRPWGIMGPGSMGPKKKKRRKDVWDSDEEDDYDYDERPASKSKRLEKRTKTAYTEWDSDDSEYSKAEEDEDMKIDVAAVDFEGGGSRGTRGKARATQTDQQICAVCFDKHDRNGSNKLVLCDSCDLAVHSSCYGVSTPAPDEWYCDSCDSLSGKLLNTAVSHCRLCPVQGGAIKEGMFKDGLKSVHVTCAKECGVKVDAQGELCFEELEDEVGEGIWER
jgi:hypothetical protein